jgi:hypothetical protein
MTQAASQSQFSNVEISSVLRDAIRVPSPDGLSTERQRGAGVRAYRGTKESGKAGKYMPVVETVAFDGIILPLDPACVKGARRDRGSVPTDASAVRGLSEF